MNVRLKSLAFLTTLVPSLAIASEEAPPKPTEAMLARRTNVQIAGGPGGMASTWRGDGGVAGSLRLGVRFIDLFSFEFIGRLGYATIDERTLAYFGFGGTIYGRLGVVRPFARIAIVHQHEETIAALKHDTGGALLGIGDGIRHRGGFSWSIGADIPIDRRGPLQWFVGVDALATVFPDPRGPSWYFGGGGWVGFNYSL
jgi:hypothetical protein